MAVRIFEIPPAGSLARCEALAAARRSAKRIVKTPFAVRRGPQRRVAIPAVESLNPCHGLAVSSRIARLQMRLLRVNHMIARLERKSLCEVETFTLR